MDQENRALHKNTPKKTDSPRAALRRRIVLGVLAAVVVCSAVLCAGSLRNEWMRKSVNYSYSGVLQQQSIYPMDVDAQRQNEKVKETERHGQTGKFRYFCNTYLTFDHPFASGSILFGNVVSNDCILVFSIVDEAGTQVYRSDGIEPNKYVSQIRLWHEFAPGEHACRLYVSAYDRDTYAYRGTQYTDLTVFIGG